MTRFVSRFGLAVFAACWIGAGCAQAADKVVFAPPPAWIDLPAPPDAPLGGDGAAVKMLFDDNQSHIGPDGDDFFNRRVIKVLKPEGLSSLTSESFTWDPAVETLTIHTLAIRRGEQVIDLLKDRDKVLVIRRETGLEEGLLDGRLTATRQIDGLQVGDSVDMAWTVTRHDPVAKGHSEEFDGLSGGVTGRYRVRISWPSGDPVRWRATPGFGEPKITTTNGRTTLFWEATNVEPPNPPTGAPPRFAAVGRLFTSSFGRWEDVSALIYPLFDKAAALEPDSALKAEAAAIAARSTDPKVRAFEALQLVESKVRYFFVGTDDGGYVPAAADETWRRRFGDCKGKTVLLLALLRQLGVQAEPALVSTQQGDGMDQNLPGLGWFNHVIIRATIDGKVYWLDGTREADLGGLKTLSPPAWRWALPLRAGGAALEPIIQAPLDQPQLAVRVELDARKGLDVPARAEMHITFTGDLALAMRLATAKASKADLQRVMLQSFAKNMSWITAKDISWHDLPEQNTFEFVLVGDADMDWRDNPDVHMREFHFPDTTSGGGKMYAIRDGGFELDAPYAVPYPFFMEGVIDVALPDGGKGFSVRPWNIAETIGGYEIKRSDAIVDGHAVIKAAVRTVASEIPASSVAAANKTMRQLGDQQEYLRAPPEPAAAAKPGA
jgi:hypothetical protein